MKNIVITISRQYGSGGKTIGAMLAKELGVNCYSREILRMASDDSGINERLFGMSDEKIRKLPGKGNQAAGIKGNLCYYRPLRGLRSEGLSKCCQCVYSRRQKVLSGQVYGTSQYDRKRNAEIY